jgi:hypothetical protein
MKFIKFPLGTIKRAREGRCGCKAARLGGSLRCQTSTAIGSFVVLSVGIV